MVFFIGNRPQFAVEAEGTCQNPSVKFITSKLYRRLSFRYSQDDYEKFVIFRDECEERQISRANI